MSLADTVRGALATIDSVTKPLQVDVQHQAYIGQNGEGDFAFAPVVSRKALVVQGHKSIMAANGTIIPTMAYIGFFAPVPPTAPNTGQERFNPIDPRDIFTLPDGTSGETMQSQGLLDGGLSTPYYNEVYLVEKVA